jgi:phosphotransacetylase
MAERTKFQQKIIKNYYDNREAISLQRVQEIITELYLSEGKKREKYWKSLAAHLEKLGVKPEQIDHLIAQNNPELAARLVEKLGKD